MRKNCVDVLLDPGMNIHRNPLNGRNFEYFSEDPLLTGEMACAELRGMNACGVTGALKHSAANNQEHKRDTVDSVVSERALREIYLRGFEMAVHSGKASCIMTTYGPVNGVWTAGNRELIIHILRQQWGFDGVVMTDWWAKMNDPGEAPRKENTAAMIQAQNDLYMVNGDADSNSNHDNSESTLQSGRLSRRDLLSCAWHICGFLMGTPAFLRQIGTGDKMVRSTNEPSSVQQDGLRLNIGQIGKNQGFDLSGVDLRQGGSLVVAFQVRNKGEYRFSIEASSTLSELSQSPLAISLNGTTLATWNVRGASEQICTTLMNIGENVDNYLRLTLPLGGLRLGKAMLYPDDVHTPSERSFISS